MKNCTSTFEADPPICKKCPAVLEKTTIDLPWRVIIGSNLQSGLGGHLSKRFDGIQNATSVARLEMLSRFLTRYVIELEIPVRMRKHGTRPDPDTGEPRQRWRCKANHVLMENARPRIDPDRRRPPPCPVIVGDKRCGEERSWWCKKPELRAHCPVHGRRRLTDEEIAAHDAGLPYPEPKKVFKPKRDLRKVKA